MTTTFRRLGRSAYAILAVALTAAVALPNLAGTAHAFPVGGQVQSRSITISSGVANASGVTYDVKFTSASSYTIKGIIIDFCDDTSTPIIGDSTCNTTDLGSFTVGASPSVTLVSGISGGTWVSGAASLNSGRTLKLTDTTGNALTGGSTVVEFTINAVHNPNFTGTFYARVITYASASGDIASYAPGTEGSTDATDYGGFALSTSSTVNITAKVAETLRFCVSKNTIAANCGSLVAPSITLGHGANNILDSSQVDTTPAYTQVSTNAAGGIKVRMKALNSCVNGGMSTNGGGTCNIPGIGTNATIPATTADFGMCVEAGSGVTAATDYLDTNNGCTTQVAATTYGMVGANLTSTYGDLIYSSSGPLNQIQSILHFAAQASLTTPAGIYTANESLIATGTF